MGACSPKKWRPRTVTSSSRSEPAARAGAPLRLQAYRVAHRRPTGATADSADRLRQARPFELFQCPARGTRFDAQRGGDIRGGDLAAGMGGDRGLEFDQCRRDSPPGGRRRADSPAPRAGRDRTPSRSRTSGPAAHSAAQAAAQWAATKSATSRLNSSACSIIAQCPQRLSSTARLSGICASSKSVFS